MISTLTLWATAAVASMLKCTMVSLPTVTFVEDPAVSCATSTYDVQFPRCRSDNPAVRKLNQLIEESVRESAEYDDAAVRARTRAHSSQQSCEDIPMEIGGSCRLPYQIGRTLSFQCRTVWNGERSSGNGWAMTVEIREGSIREMTLNDLLEPGARNAFWNLVRNELVKQQFPVDDEDPGSVSGPEPEFNLTPVGLHLDFNYRFGGRRPAILDIPYSSLRGLLGSRYVPQASRHYACH